VAKTRDIEEFLNRAQKAAKRAEKAAKRAEQARDAAQKAAKRLRKNATKKLKTDEATLRKIAQKAIERGKARKAVKKNSK